VTEINGEEREDRGWKNKGRAGFFQTLASNFLLFRAWNPPLFIEIRRGIFCL
jgi:hypothetical protein